MVQHWVVRHQVVVAAKLPLVVSEAAVASLVVSEAELEEVSVELPGVPPEVEFAVSVIGMEPAVLVEDWD